MHKFEILTENISFPVVTKFPFKSVDVTFISTVDPATILEIPDPLTVYIGEDWSDLLGALCFEEVISKIWSISEQYNTKISILN